MPIAYAVTYMFGTVGSAIVIAVLGPKLLGINLEAACKDYEEKQGGGTKEIGGAGSAWHRWAVRAYRVAAGGKAVGLRAIEAEALVPDARVFVLRIRRNGKIEEATADTVLREGDVIAVAGARDVLVNVARSERDRGRRQGTARRPGRRRGRSGQQQGSRRQDARRSWPRCRQRAAYSCARSRAARPPPTYRSWRTRRCSAATFSPSSVARRTRLPLTKLLGVADRPTDVADVAFVGVWIVMGALIGSLVVKVGGAPMTLSTAGGALIAGIVGGWLRSVRPSFGRIPTPTVWFMNSVGLNIFIAIVGISAGPGFVNGLKTQGVGLFLWGALATTVPLVLGMFVAKYLFRFHDALTLGIVSGSRTTTASLGLVCDQAKSQVPALGYTVTYAVGNTLLTIWGMVIIMLMS